MTGIKTGAKVVLAPVVPTVGEENAPLLEAVARQIEEVVVFCNSLMPAQQRALETLTGADVMSAVTDAI